MSKQLIFGFILIVTGVTISYGQKKESYFILKESGNSDTLIIAENNFIKTGELFERGVKSALLIYPIDQNVFHVDILKFERLKWITIFRDTVEFGFLRNVYIEDVNNDQYADFILKTSSGGEMDILFLTDSNQWYQSDYFNLGYTRLYSDYYYTYMAVGCADSEWVSDLISFSGTTVKEHAKLHVENCNDTPYEVTLQKVNGESKTELTPDFATEINKDKLKLFWASYMKKL